MSLTSILPMLSQVLRLKSYTNMKKILIPILFFLLTIPVLSQTGTGWVPQRVKANFRDSTYFYKDARFNGTVRVSEGNLRLGAVTISANGLEINILDGLLSSTAELNYLVGVTSNVQTQLNTKAPIANPQFTGTARLATDTLATMAYVRSNSSGLGSTDTVPLIDVGFIKSDTATVLATKHDLTNIEGGSSTSTWDVLQFTVDITTGAPSVGDSSFAQNSFIGKNIGLYRGGLRQSINNTATNTTEGFRFNSTTGTITVNPPFITEEKIIISIDEPINYTYLSIEGQESTLLDSLLAYYAFDETSGSTVNDALGINNGTSNAVVNQTGILGKARLYDGNDYMSVANNTSLRPTADEYSVSLWFRLTSLPSTEGHIGALLRARHSTIPSYAINIYIQTDETISFYVANQDGIVTEFESNASAVVTDTWYHLVCVNEGNGQVGKIYLNGSDVNTYATAFTGDLLEFNSTIYVGNFNSSDSYGIVGYIDEVALFNEALTSGQVTELYNSGLGNSHPF